MELEYALSLEELIATLDAIRKREEREFKFHASLQGVEYGSSSSSDLTFEEILEREMDPTTNMDEGERLAYRGIGFESVG